MPKVKLYSVPRRFDLTTIFVVTAAYSLLFAVTRAVIGHAQSPSTESLIFVSLVTLFITVVGVAQAVLFGGKKPRLASALAGAACLILFSATLTVWDWWSQGLLAHEGFYYALGQLDFFVALAINGSIYGAILGYLAGVLVGGVFLVADRLRRIFGRNGSRDDQQRGCSS